MPELEGTRGLEDILAGHRAAGLFVPGAGNWGDVPGEPEAAAVLLLTEVPGRDAWEVIYLGLTPAARGRGLGRAVIRHALEAGPGHAPILELAVDLRNTPAVRLYRSTGFPPRDRRAVHPRHPRLIPLARSLPGFGSLRRSSRARLRLAAGLVERQETGVDIPNRDPRSPQRASA